MQAFRNAAKPVVYLITITFMIWMLVDLSGISGSAGMFSRTSVGSVNGQSIDTRSYEQAVQDATTQRQQQSGRSLSLEETQALRDEVWQSFVQSTVMRDEIARRHITVTPDEVASLIMAVPPPQLQQAPDFQTNGQFDPSKYQRWLQSAVGQQYVPALEAQYRDEILRAKLLRNVTADIFLSEAALWERYRDQNETVSITLTPLVPNRVIPDSAVVVSDDEIAAYYRSHPDEFDRPATAFLSYIGVPRSLDASDSAAALEHAREVRAELVKDTAWADVARRESADAGSAALGGNLGTFARGAMVSSFDAAVFSMPIGTISDPVLSENGYHLIEVLSRTADSATARHVLIPVELAGAHRDLVDAQADSLEQLGADRLDPAALDTAARALKLPIGQSAPVQQGTRAIVGPYLVGDAGVWAFQGKVGETSPIVETPEFYYVFRLDSLQQSGVPPLTAIRASVANAVTESKKDALALDKANQFVSRVKAGETMVEASRAMGLENREFPAFARIQPPLPNPKLIGTAFGLPVGALSEPIVTKEGIYVIRVLAHTPADSAAFRRDLDQMQSREVRAARDERVRFFLQALNERAKVKDDRAKLFKTSAQAEAGSSALLK
ncbi:MAG: SurA N-terminal domain-containing protein [Gemmatimonadota bacterium]